MAGGEVLLPGNDPVDGMAAPVPVGEREAPRSACGRPTVVQPDPTAQLVDLGAMDQASMRCGTSERWL